MERLVNREEGKDGGVQHISVRRPVLLLSTMHSDSCTFMNCFLLQSRSCLSHCMQVFADNAHKNFARGNVGDHVALMNIFDGWAESNFSTQWCYENYVQASHACAQNKES